jgi:hypothetical protein
MTHFMLLDTLRFFCRKAASFNGSRSLRSRQNDGHYVVDSNQNHNHDMKTIFKSAASMASSREGAFHDFYQGLLTKGMEPAMARLTLARKIATITLILWKKGANFDAKQLKPQAA